MLNMGDEARVTGIVRAMKTFRKLSLIVSRCEISAQRPSNVIPGNGGKSSSQRSLYSLDGICYFTPTDSYKQEHKHQ